jgi:hypothetical protein
MAGQPADVTHGDVLKWRKSRRADRRQQSEGKLSELASATVQFAVKRAQQLPGIALDSGDRLGAKPAVNEYSQTGWGRTAS